MPEINNVSSFDTFEEQTGGHKSIKGVRCMIKDDSGHLLKYLEDTYRGENEENFYKAVFTDRDFLPLKTFLPKYYGSIDVKQGDEILKYVKLENLLYGFDIPNIMDIKVGKITYDPFSSAEKILKETTKYPGQEETGFRLGGLKVYDSQKKIFRNITPREFRTCSCFTSPKEKSIGYCKQIDNICDVP